MDKQHNNHYHRLDMSPVLVGLLGVLAGAIIVAICHCILALCNETQRQMFSTRNNNVSGREHISTANSTVEYSTVQVIIQSNKEINEDLCAVCLGEFKAGERVSVLPDCAHIFHVSCINKWLENHSNCPLCRTSTILSSHVNAASSSDSDRIPTTEINRTSVSSGVNL